MYWVSGSGRSPGVEMATHSSILACKISRTEVSGRLQCIGSQRVRHESDLANTSMQMSDDANKLGRQLMKVKEASHMVKRKNQE